MTPHRSYRLARLTAVVLASGALAAPTAIARPAPPDPKPSPDRAPVVRAIDEGFDWGSAAIGAGAAGALIVLSLGGLGGASRSRIRVAR